MLPIGARPTLAPTREWRRAATRARPREVDLDQVLDLEAVCAEQADPFARTDVELDAACVRLLKAVHVPLRPHQALAGEVVLVVRHRQRHQGWNCRGRRGWPTGRRSRGRVRNRALRVAPEGPRRTRSPRDRPHPRVGRFRLERSSREGRGRIGADVGSDPFRLA